MPDAKCDKCPLKLGPICNTPEKIQRFSDLVYSRSTKMLGQIVKISPGIHHNEIDTDSNCDGVLWYRPFDATPDNVNW
jgi:hypothetical protein